MILRPYQIDILEKLSRELILNDEVVIASAPNSGKTLMAIEFIKRNPNATFLILTHGTLVLKEQWKSSLNGAGLDCSDKLGESRITYGVPHGLYKKSGYKVDYIFIDEGHEFAFARMVREIKEKFNPNKIIYLTGTPSKFIAKKYPVIIVPGIDLIKDGYSSDLYIGMVSTNAKIFDSDRNEVGDVKYSGEHKLESTVESDLSELLQAMDKRLRETGAFKSSPYLRKTVEWAPTLGKLHKTMIACQSIKQATLVNRYFETAGINSILSHSKLDLDSANIQQFKTDPNVKVLVVVDRGILGFDMADLVNVVDLTGSRNIDRIYQLYARVMRKNDQYDKKYFFKFATEQHMLLDKFYMNAAISMLNGDFISKFNGRNLKEMEIPVLIKTGSRKDRIKSKKPSKNGFAVIEKDFYDLVTAGAALENIYNKIGQTTNEYAYATFGKILEREFGKKFFRPIIDITEENLRYMIETGEIDERIYG